MRTKSSATAELADAQIQIDRTPIEGRAAARLEDESTRMVAITRRERYTLLAIRRMFDVFKGTPFAEDERFTDAEALRAQPFTVPDDFRLDDELQSPFDLYSNDTGVTHHVVIEFRKERAAYARARQWHKQQNVENRADGAVRIAFPLRQPRADRLVGARLGARRLAR